MGLVVILSLVTFLSVLGLIKSFKTKNGLAIGFSLVSALVFGWFVVMTVLNSGYPAA